MWASKQPADWRRVRGEKGRLELQQHRPTELRIDDSIILVGPAVERDVMTAFLYVYVEDVDAAFERALQLGAVALEHPRDTPYGDRRAMVRDPWANTWQIATRLDDATR